MPMTEIRAVIVDDERLARRDLRVLLKAHPQISIIGEADTLETAIEVIGRLEPDVVFLDIQMPGGSGFTVLNRIDPAIQVVFVTAYDEYAVRAFEVDACDYLLKPVNPKRLAKPIARLQSLSEPVATAEPEKSPALSLPSTKPLTYEDYVFVRRPPNAGFVKVKSVLLIRAAGDYSELYLSDQTKCMLKKSLRDWEAILPQPQFLRVHRATILNLDYVEQIEPSPENTYRFTLRGLSEPVVSSRSYSTVLRERFCP